MKRIGVGIDFGTSNSVAATFDGAQLKLVQLEPNNPVTPSATYISKQLKTQTGQAAIDAYIEGNSRRKVELVPELIGQASVLTGAGGTGRCAPSTLTTEVYSEPRLDHGLPGRLFRGVKRLLGRVEIQRLTVFDHAFRPVALVTPLLLRILRQTWEECGQTATACIGHPVNFEGKGLYKNRLGLSRLREAYRLAGLSGSVPFPEPIAAAISYLHLSPDQCVQHLLTFDFGGGTLDFCILQRQQGTKFRVVATHGIPLGGDHIDRRLFETLLFPLLGDGERWARKGEERWIDTPFPFENYREKLLNWSITYLLNQNRYTTPIYDCLAMSPQETKRKFYRLLELIRQNYGYEIFDQLRNLKVALSSQTCHVLDIPQIDVRLEVNRSFFERNIADFLDRIEQAIDVVLADAKLDASQIDLVLRTGGSSQIPSVERILSDRFEKRIVSYDPFTSVAAGLAIANFHGYSPTDEMSNAANDTYCHSVTVS